MLSTSVILESNHETPLICINPRGWNKTLVYEGTGKISPKRMQSPNSLDIMSTSSPSPTAAAAVGASTNSRRPPRKSTLTQQQKNQKRQRATQDQLVTLEVEFNKNPTPTAPVRERIAQDISMTERSVQIWFQNRSVHQMYRRWIVS